MTTYLIPVYIIGGFLLLFGILILLGRWRQGRYLKPLLMVLQKVPFMERWLQRASRAALEKQNPDLANAIRKLERAGSLNDPLAAQRAMSKLTAGERRAYIEAAGEQGPGPSNRAERRRL
ncbi:MAG: hypothetical protein H0W87_04310, partial [Actinobacteria bacterium]|nr:hypothetical protein [Actinomycetota bacterium]